ncbi:MAG: hypothetical protein C4334_03730 [Pyrinomonas sp.]
MSQDEPAAADRAAGFSFAHRLFMTLEIVGAKDQRKARQCSVRRGWLRSLYLMRKRGEQIVHEQARWHP